MLHQASPEVRLRATFHIIQGWWGDINMEFVPLTSTVVFHRHLEEIGTKLEVIFTAKDQDGSNVRLAIPIHHFTHVWHTDRKSAADLPTALVFHFTDEGFESFKEKLPLRVAEWEPRLKEKKRVLSRSLLFVLDPSDFIMAEDGLTLYRPGFIEGIELFKLNYNEQWENHLCEQKGQYGQKFEDAIKPIEGKDFTVFFKKFGLRNVESDFLAGVRKKPIRIFLARRHVIRKPRRVPKRRFKPRKTSTGNEEEDDKEDEEDDDDDKEEDDDEEKEEEDHEMEVDDSQPGPSTSTPPVNEVIPEIMEVLEERDKKKEMEEEKEEEKEKEKEEKKEKEKDNGKEKGKEKNGKKEKEIETPDEKETGYMSDASEEIG